MIKAQIKKGTSALLAGYKTTSDHPDVSQIDLQF